MINANIAIRESDDWFARNYEPEIKFIDDKIWEVVYEGLRSVWIDKEDGWVCESEMKTQRLIKYFKELGFKVEIVKEGLGNMSMWKNDCSGIRISWE